MNSFSVRTKIMEGGGLETLAPKLHKVFIVTDGFMASSGKVSYITEKLDRAGAEYRVFDQVKADPDIGTVTKGVDMIQEFHPDAVIAFGGGSPIDAAKAIVFFAAKTCDMRECMFIAVPTTSGTGSEVSKFAVITDPEKEVKYPLVEDSLLPDVAILDAELTVSVPPSVTADTGIDVFTHAVEALVSTAATDFSDAAAEKAIKLVRRHLMTAYHQPGDMAARQGMHNASCLAGVAFSNSGLGLNHGMAHALNLIRTARRYVEQLNIPSSIQAAGVDKAEFEAEAEAMAEAALADRCTATNPRTCSKEEILPVFHKAYLGRLP